MKKVVALFVLLAVVGGYAAEKNNTETAKWEKAEKALLMSLKSENRGVRNSTLHVLAKIKSDDPELDMSVFNSSLLRMVRRDNDPMIRANANIIYTYINNNELAQNLSVSNPEDPAAFFASLYSELDAGFMMYAD